MLDRHVYTVLKDGKLLLFPNNEFGLWVNNTFNKKDFQLIVNQGFVEVIGNKKFVDKKELYVLIANIYGLGANLIQNIVSEWLRDKFIYHRMSESSDKYWNYLILPNYYKEIEDSEFNF